MFSHEGNIRALLTGDYLKQRVQHPKINECKDWKTAYWFFRYWHDEPQPDGSVKSTRKRQIVGPSKGLNAITKKQAEGERDKFLVNLNAAPTRPEAAAADRRRRASTGIRTRRDHLRQAGPDVAHRFRGKVGRRQSRCWPRPREPSTSSTSRNTSCRGGRTRASGSSARRKCSTGSRTRARRGTTWPTCAAS